MAKTKTKEPSNSDINKSLQAADAAIATFNKARGTNFGSLGRLEETPAPTPTRTPKAPKRVNPDSFETFDDYRKGNELNDTEYGRINDRYSTYLQKQIALIDAEFLGKTSRQTEENRGMEARTRVLNANTGNLDSGTGITAINKEEKKSKEALDQLATEKSARISKVMGDIDQLKVKEIEAETTRKRNDRVAYQALRKENSEKALATLEEYATAGGNLDALKLAKASDDDELSDYDHLQKASGLTPLEFDTKFNAFKRAGEKIDYTFKVVGNKVIGYGVDPMTGKVRTIEQDVPGLADDEWQIKETKDGALYKYNSRTGTLLPLLGKPSDEDTTTETLVSNAPTWEEYLDAAEKVKGQSFPPDMQNELKKQYDAAYKSSSSIGGKLVPFTKAQKLKLEAAGKLNAPREEQLKVLYPKAGESASSTVESKVFG